MADELGFRSYLASHRLKYTPERKLIFDEIIRSKQAFAAEELVNRLRHRHGHVSRATVYRTLDLLRRMGVVARVGRGDKPALYDRLPEGQHRGYFVCILCGGVETFSVADFGGKFEAEAKQRGFDLSDHCLQLSGFCAKCRADKHGKIRR